MSFKARTAPLAPEITDRLLDLLSTDDLFRERFQRDHLEALATIGYTPPEPGKATACGLMPAVALEPFAECKVNALASKEAILAARAEIKAMLTQGLAHSTHNLDKEHTASRRSLK